MTPDIQPRGVLHVGVDNYFTVAREFEDGAGDFPTDFGLTLGVLPGTKLQAEVGVDGFEPADHPLVFNAKLGVPENVLFAGAPTLQVGAFGFGTESGVTNANVVQLILGKSISGAGRVSAGPYFGNGEILVDGDGHEEKSGFSVAFDRAFGATTTASGDAYSRFVAVADYASGDNAVGGGAVGLYYYFHPDVSLLTGPVWFNDEDVNGKWKWTIQLDANRVVFGK